MILRHPWSLSALLLAGVALAVAPPRNMRDAAMSPRYPSPAICPAGPSGAEPDVLGPSSAVPDYAVSVTPKGGSATWPVNTNGHTAAFTVTNTGNCEGTYTFSSGDAAPISGVTLDKTSKFLLHGESTPVTATYNVGGAGSGVLTVRASGHAIADSGWYNVTVVAYGVAVTPDAQPATVPATRSQSLRFEVRNTGSATNTYAMSCTASTNETCGTVIPSQLTLGAAASDSVTVNFTAGAVGTAGTVTLTAAGGGSAADNGSYSLTNARFGVVVTPDARTRSVTANAIQSVTFQVRDTGAVNDTYTLTCGTTGSETCGTVSPVQLADAAPGITNVVMVMFTAGAAGTSGTVTLRASDVWGVSDVGSYTVTNVAALTAVTPDAQTLSVNANSSRSLTFQVQNLGSGTETYTLSCATTGNADCGTVSPSQVTVGPGAAGPVTVSLTAGAVGTGTLTLRAAGTRGGSDEGSFTLTNTTPTATTGVAVTPANWSITTHFASPVAVSFVVQNTGSATDTYTLTCTASGQETCNSGGNPSPSQVTLAPSAAAPVVVSFVSGAVNAGGAVALNATGTGGASDANFGAYSVWNVNSPPVGQSVAVTYISGAASWPSNTTGHVALFAVRNTGASTDGFIFSCSGTGPVTCASFPPGADLQGGSTTTIAVTYNVGAPGSGALTLTARSGTGPATSRDSISVSAVAPTYAVVVTPDGQPRSVDVNSAQGATFQVKAAGTVGETYTFACTPNGNETCGAINPPSAVLSPGDSVAVTANFNALAMGAGTVTLRATGSGGSSDNGSYALKNTYFVAVSPDGQPASRLATRAYSDSFTVRNPGLNQATYNLTASCSGTAIASGCTPSLASLTLVDADSARVAVSYTTGAAGTSGQVKLIAIASADVTAKDSGWTSVTVGTAQASVVDVASVNPGTTRARGLCLTFAAGDGAATECGDMRLVHPLPATRTLNKLRAPTLLYNSIEARPYPLVAANVTLPAGAATPDTVFATLKVGGVTYGIAKWVGTDWTPGSARRIVVADTTGTQATGIVTYTLTVTNQWNGLSSLTSPGATASVAVVNRQQSGFGAGWWLAGLERLYTGTMLWVGGDGSTRQYTLVSANVWAAPNVDRPDTLKFDGTRYTRFLPHGVRVVFDGQGRHVFTIGRLSDTTKFTWSGGDTLLTIVLPRTGHAYQFSYSSGSRWVVTAPSVTGQTRADTGMISGGRLTTIRGPDTTRVSFGYAGGTDANLIVSRTDRRGNVTTYGFDGGKRLVKSVRPDIGTTVWQALETVGLPASDASHAADTALAHTRYDGPRSDVWDTTAFWLDRFGAPRRIVNALGYQTVITRGDSRWPALATQLQGPTGVVTQAAYSARGNVDSVTVLNPLGDGSNAVTRYAWDTVWDLVKSVTLPQGEITQFGYDPANGNRRWQQPGTDSTRRVRFFYTDTLLLRAVEYPTSPPTRDSIAYDVMGNARLTVTPLGATTAWTRDAVGRETLVKSALVTSGSKSTFESHAYDKAGEDTLRVTYSDSTGELLTVRTRYDAEGNTDSVLTRSTPDTNHIDWQKHVFTYDRANRQATEQTVGLALITFAYDPAGNLLNGGRQGGNNITVTYDALNRPIRRAEAGGDTAVFAYDTLGSLLTANNANARITRTYYRGGALQSETQALSTDFLPAHDFSKHVYAQQFRYDLNGRRVWARHPVALAPGSDTVAYGYDPVFGQLATLTDPLGTRYVFAFDSLGRSRRLTRFPLGQDSVYETLGYDNDGRVTTRLVRTGSTTVLQETLGYDARAKVASAAISRFGASSTDAFQYAPLGAVVQASIPPTGSETYTGDALGNRTRMARSVGSAVDDYFYQAGTGILLRRDEQRPGSGYGLDSTLYTTAWTGENIVTHRAHCWPDMFYVPGRCERRDVISIYDAQRRLIRTDFYFDTIPTPYPTYRSYRSQEAYRYDALGRRVYVRAVRGPNCAQKDQGSGCLSTLTRAVWDGDQVLYELRGPGDSGSSQLETDPPTTDLLHGVVGYLHAGGIDQPLALWKGTSELVLPYATYRGAVVAATCPTVGCSSGVWLPQADQTPFWEASPYPNGPPNWHGSLIEGGTDASGYQYKRNRYYDPSSGRFTQDDPLGLAGGLNLYGFAGGDPINFSDPFGLCHDKNGKEIGDKNCREVTAAEGQKIYDAAVATGKWTWTEDKTEDTQTRICHRRGDCTDHVEAGMEGGGAPALDPRPATYQFAGSSDYVAVTGTPQVGDVIVQGGHAGTFSGKYDGKGRPLGIQNGGGGTAVIPWGKGVKGLANVDPVFYRRQVPINP